MADTQPPPQNFCRTVPVDADFDHWLTVGFQRRVLVVVRTVTTLNRLLDVLALFADDHRVQVVFTFDRNRPAILGEGMPAALRRLGVAVVAWEQATRTRFDLAIAASENDDLHLIDAPVVLLPHGIGYQKYYPGSTTVAGMDPQRLVRGGRVIPALIAVTHAAQRTQLQAISPAAAARAEVVGDPCLDRILAGEHRAADYRNALGATTRRVVAVASTWGRKSLLGSCPDLPLRLVSELPVDDTAVCLVLHPGIAAAHGRWQVEAWLTQARDAGLRVIPPEAGWQSAITAASCVICDTGSVSLYAAALDRPLLMAGGPADSTVPGSPSAALGSRADPLRSDHPLDAQIDQAIARHTPGQYEPVLKHAVAVPGRAAELLREAFYRLMRLPEPPGRAEFTPHPLPRASATEPVAFVVGERARVLVRLPATTAEHRLDHQHIAAHATRASLAQLTAAAIVFTDLADEDRADFDDWARAALGRWPDAHVAAARLPDRCLARDRRGVRYELVPNINGIDPLAAASLVYLGRTREVEHCGIGARTVTVTIRTA